MSLAQIRLALFAGAVLVALSLSGCGDDGRISAPSPQGGGVPGTADPCDAATLALRGLYEELQGCVLSEDCQYVDGFFELVPRSETDREITVFDCHEPTPFLVVANGSLVQQRLTELEQGKAAQNAACARGEDVVVCEGFSTRLTTPSPICEAGRCVAPPQTIAGNSGGR